MPTVDGMAPESPNVFADGSASLPKDLRWSTASPGIYYPERSEEFTAIEDDLMTCKTCNPREKEAYGAISGPCASSTRSELGAMLGAALAPYPIHVGMDNIFVVRRTTLLVRGEPVHPFKPWQLLPDGHLWKSLADAIAQRGLASIVASWVKGHAKEVHVQKGITTQRHRECNHRVDAVAEQGQVHSHPDGLRRLGQLYCARQERYADLMRHVHQVIVQTHLEATMQRADLGEEDR